MLAWTALTTWFRARAAAAASAGQVLQALKTQLHTGCHFLTTASSTLLGPAARDAEPNAPLTDDECWLLRRAKGIPRLELYARLRILRARTQTQRLGRGGSRLVGRWLPRTRALACCNKCKRM